MIAVEAEFGPFESMGELGVCTDTTEEENGFRSELVTLLLKLAMLEAKELPNDWLRDWLPSEPTT